MRRGAGSDGHRAVWATSELRLENFSGSGGLKDSGGGCGRRDDVTRRHRPLVVAMGEVGGGAAGSDIAIRR